MIKELFTEKKLQKRFDNSMKRQLYTPEVPNGLFRKCPKCNEIVYTDDCIDAYHSCPKCKYYFRIDARVRISMLTDEGSFCEWDNDIEINNKKLYSIYRNLDDNDHLLLTFVFLFFLIIFTFSLFI